MRQVLVLTTVLLAGGVALAAAQQTGMPKKMAGMPDHMRMTDSAKIAQAEKAAPADIAKGAAVAEMDEKGAMKQLRAGTNGWTCMLLPASPGVMDAMCGDKTWGVWAEAYMAKKTPQVKTLGISYMLQGDHGASNTDPFAMSMTASNQWVVSPPHVMLLVPDAKLLDSLPTDPHTGGAWVMWKGTPYAHIMVPTMPVAMRAK